MTIKKIINSIFSSNTYILSDNKFKTFWLIDIGDVKSILKYVPSNGLVEGVLLTHTHFDHIYGLNCLLSNFPKCSIYTCEDGKIGLYSDKYNYSRYHGTSLNFIGGDIHVINEGETITLFTNCIAEVYSTPGHDTSCLTFRIGKYIFTGDSYIPNLKVVTSFLRSNKQDAEESKKRIISLITEGDIVCPGHGEISWM